MFPSDDPFDFPDFDQDMKATRKLMAIAGTISLIVSGVVIVFLCLSGCTINLNNITNSGEASDLVDEVTTEETQAQLSIPAL
jgi:hypothetical protein